MSWVRPCTVCPFHYTFSYKPVLLLSLLKHVEDAAAVRRSLLDNPFEKFERKRFLHHAEDLGRIEFALGVWRYIREDPVAGDLIRRQMLDDLEKYFEPLDGLDKEATAMLFAPAPRTSAR